MGTRGLWGLKSRDRVIAIFAGRDSYPSYLGARIIELIRNTGTDELKDFFEKRSTLPDDVDFESMTIKDLEKDYRQLITKEFEDLVEFICRTITDSSSVTVRKHQLRVYNLLEVLQPELVIKNKVYFFRNSIEFINDSIFCEYAYILNLDEEVLELYCGFNTDPEEAGPYASIITEDHNEVVYGSRLVTTIPFSFIRDENNTENLEKVLDLIETNNRLFSLRGQVRDLDEQKVRGYLGNVWNAIQRKREEKEIQDLVERLNQEETKKVLKKALISATEYEIINRYLKKSEITRVYLVGSLSEVTYDEYMRLVENLVKGNQDCQVYAKVKSLFEIHGNLTEKVVRWGRFSRAKINSSFEELLRVSGILDSATQGIPGREISIPYGANASYRIRIKQEVQNLILRRIFLKGVKALPDEEKSEELRDVITMLDVIDNLLENGIYASHVVICDNEIYLYLIQPSIFDFII